MKLDKKITPLTIVLTLCCFLFPFISAIVPSPYSERVVSTLEGLQALWLFFCCLFTLGFVYKSQLKIAPKIFWLWSAAWWLVLFGRSISWGRDYFPEVTRWIFRLISVLLIALLIVPLLISPILRKEIRKRLYNDSLLIWTFSLVVISFLISDAVEHNRLIAPLFLHDIAYKDLIEELYEIPFMVGLFCVSYDLMRKEKRRGLNRESIV